MPDWVLPLTFINLLAELRPVFTKASYASFLVLVAGWIYALGAHRLSNVILAAVGWSFKHYSAYYRFFSAGRWSLDALGLALLRVIVRGLGVCEIELVLDDTLCRRSGKKVALGMMHADPLLRYKGKPFVRYGHVFVILAVHVISATIAKTGWALPVLFRLFESTKQGGQKDGPSTQKRAAGRRRHEVPQRQRLRKTDRQVVDGKLVECTPRPDSGPLPEGVRPTKLQLGADLVLMVARAFPQVRFRVLADHAYNGRALLHTVLSQVNNVVFTARGHKDAALFELPPARSGKRGRPRVKGQRLPTPEQWAARHCDVFRPVTVDMYGKEVHLEVASYVGVAHRTLPGRLVKYVIVRDPRGIYGTAYLMCTDPTLADEEVVRGYSHRWTLETSIQETKQKLGLQDPQTQLPTSVRRTAPFALLTYSFIVWWYMTEGFQEAQQLCSMTVPWYPKTARPSFTDMLATLRRLGWAKGFFASAGANTPRSKMLESYLYQVAAVT